MKADMAMTEVAEAVVAVVAILEAEEAVVVATVEEVSAYAANKARAHILMQTTSCITMFMVASQDSCRLVAVLTFTK